MQGAPEFTTQDVEGALTALIAGVSAVVAIGQLRRSALTARANFLFNLGKTVQEYGELHRKLVLRKWVATTDEDTQEMRRYIALFEEAQVFIERGALDLASVDWVLGHRVFRIINNDVIRGTILSEKQKKHWEKFFALAGSLKRRRGAYSRLEREARDEIPKLLRKLDDGNPDARKELLGDYYDVILSRYPDVMRKLTGAAPLATVNVDSGSAIANVAN